jgi:GNAT superfamily N-acetyltransferase
MEAPSDLRAARPTALQLRIEQRVHCTVAEYRRLYRAVGAAWHWHDRDAWTDEQLAAYLADPRVHVWIARLDRRVAGYFELREDAEGGVELVYFGLVPELIGHGLGGALLTHAVEEAWRLGARRVWLHTCTLDAPQALPNYLARGFRVEREETYTTRLPG